MDSWLIDHVFQPVVTKVRDWLGIKQMVLAKQMFILSMAMLIGGLVLEIFMEPSWVNWIINPLMLAYVMLYWLPTSMKLISYLEIMTQPHLFMRENAMFQRIWGLLVSTLVIAVQDWWSPSNLIAVGFVVYTLAHYVLAVVLPPPPPPRTSTKLAWSHK